MKKTLIFKILFTLLLFPFALLGQQSFRAFLLVPDTTVKVQADSNVVLWSAVYDSTQVFAFNRSRVTLRLLFPNDHRWNNWAKDTTLVFTASDTLTLNLTQLQSPYHLMFRQWNVQIGRQRNTSVYRTYLKPGLAALAIATNWASFYLKRKADDYYRRYHATSNLSKINEYYRQTQKFDRYSEIMLGISITGFTAYFALLLHDF